MSVVPFLGVFVFFMEDSGIDCSYGDMSGRKRESLIKICNSTKDVGQEKQPVLAPKNNSGKKALEMVTGQAEQGDSNEEDNEVVE